jgi:hypothetical protein
MSFYIKSPFKPVPRLLIQGTPEYVYGSFNDKVGPTLGYIISDSGNGTTSTVVFRIASGNVPFVGALISIVGTANAAGAYNVTNAIIISVVCTDAGICTVTFLGAGTSASTPDGGQVEIQQPEVPDNLTAAIVAALATNAGASFPVAAPVGSPSIGRSISATLSLLPNSATFPSTLSAVTGVIQGSDIDLDSEYNTIGTFGVALAAGSVTNWQSGQGQATTPAVLAAGNVNLPNFRFYRLNITAATGAGYIVGKIMV